MKQIALSLAGAGVLFVTVSFAQQPVLKLTATSVNVSEPGNNVRIEILRWSTDQERNQLVTALTAPAPAPAAVPAPPAPAEPTDGTPAAPPTRGGRGGARGGAAGGRGGGARGGRGGGNAAAPVDPIATFTAAIGKAPTIGYIWTNEVTGYAIKHALRLPSSNGVERIILASNRRIGANALSWTPVKGTPTPYEFTLLEIRLPSSGAGEAKASLTTTITVDNDTKAIGLDNYVTTPALLANVRRS